MERIFLAAISFLYLVLSLWCLVRPQDVLKNLGLQFVNSGGQSEFLTIYVGMEAALALIFLIPVLRTQYIPVSLVGCMIFHGGLALARATSYLLYPQMPNFIYRLGAAEWIIFIISILFVVKSQKV